MNFYEISIFDILPYFYLLIFLLFFTFRKDIVGREKLMFFFIFIFSAVRYGIGYDYFNYCNAIDDGTNFEPLSNVIIEIARFTGWKQIFFIINSFIAIFPIYYVAKNYSNDACLVILIYYLYPILFLESLSIVRNASAYSMVFLAYYFLDQKKYLKYCLCVCVAGLLHYSGFLGFILVFVYFFPCNKKLALFSFIVSFLVGEALVTSIQSVDYDGESVLFLKFIKYVNRSEEQGRLMKYIIVLFDIINIIYWNKLVKVNHKNKILLNLVNLGTCLWVALSFDRTLSLRLSSFLLVFFLLLVPSYIDIVHLKYKRLVRQIIIIFFIVFFSSGFIINVVSYDFSAKMSYIPYQTIFFYRNFLNY